MGDPRGPMLPEAAHHSAPPGTAVTAVTVHCCSCWTICGNNLGVLFTVHVSPAAAGSHVVIQVCSKQHLLLVTAVAQYNAHMKGHIDQSLKALWWMHDLALKQCCTLSATFKFKCVLHMHEPIKKLGVSKIWS